jgi:hypothetical protein
MDNYIAAAIAGLEGGARAVAASAGSVGEAGAVSIGIMLLIWFHY